MRLRRLVTVLTLGATVPGWVLLAAPAQAEVLKQATYSSGVLFTVGSGSGCVKTSGDNATSLETFLADGVPRTSTSTAAATYASADGTDVTTMSGTSTTTITATQSAGRLDTITLTRSYTASLSASKGAAQQCGARALATGSATYGFDLPAATYATVTVETHNGGAQGYVSTSTASAGAPNGVQAQAAGIGPHTTSVGHALLPAGSGYFSLQEADLQLPAPTPTTQPDATVSGSATITVQFQTPGVTTDAKTTGKGSKYVDLAAGRDCAAGTLTATWTKKAGNKKHPAVRKATFYAGGVKIGKARRPLKKTTTTLKGLDPTKAVEVTAVLKPTKKGRHKVELSRSYLPCS